MGLLFLFINIYAEGLIEMTRVIAVGKVVRGKIIFTKIKTEELI